MVCPKCDKNILDSSKYCPFCGANLKSNTIQRELKKGGASEKRHSWETIAMIAIAIILLVSGGIFGLILFTGGSDNSDITSTSDISDIGRVEPLDPSKIIIDPASGIRLVSDQVLIVFKDGVSEDFINARINSINGEVVGYLDGMNTYQVRLGNGPSLQELKTIIDDLNNDADIDIASINEVYDLCADYPNDPGWDDEWNEENPGKRNWGLEAIYAPSAWEYNNQLETVKIAVIDAGFNINHEDLRIPVENASGARERLNATPEDCAEYENPEKEAIGFNDHGTEVTGVIGALANNSIGITGIIWDREFLLYRVDFQQFDLEYALCWALEKGAQVINISLGNYRVEDLGREPSFDNNEDVKNFILKERSFYTSMTRKLADKYGDFLIVQGAGNESIDAEWNGLFCTINDEELKEKIIIVGSMAEDLEGYFPGGHSYRKARHSNYGSVVDLMAPGVSVYSTSYYEPYYADNISGTSIATPFVTGVAGMVWAANPSLSAEEVKAIIIKTSDRPFTHEGREYRVLNAKASVEEALRLFDMKVNNDEGTSEEITGEESQINWTIQYITEDRMEDISVLDNAHVWAIGGKSVYFFDGANWRIQYEAGEGLASITALDASHVWAGGDSGTIYFYDGTNWSTQQQYSDFDFTYAYRTFSDISAVNQNCVWAVGWNSIGAADIFHYDGSSWSPKEKVGGYAGAISALDDKNIWVGDMSGIFFYNGSQAVKQLDTGNDTVGSISAIDQNNVWAISYKNIYHYDGSSWKIFYETDTYLKSLCALTNNKVWAAGEDVVYYYDGSSWTEQYKAPTEIGGIRTGGVAIVSIDATDQGHVWAVIDNGGVNSAIIYSMGR